MSHTFPEISLVPVAAGLHIRYLIKALTSLLALILYSSNYGTTVIAPPSILITSSKFGIQHSSITNIILPHVLLWDPINQYKALLTDNIKCEVCFGVLTRVYWKRGQSKGKEVRILHDSEHIVYLVSAVYKCNCIGHLITAADASILKKFEEHFIPFVLFHRTGFMKSLIRCTINLISEGLTISAVERFINQERADYAAELLLQIKSLLKDQKGLNLLSPPLNLLQQPCPSDDNYVVQMFYG